MAEKKQKGIANRIVVAVVIVALVGIAIFLVPVSTEKIEIQCFTTPCNPIIVTKTIYEIILTERPNEQPTACILIFDPVCGVDGITYGNACFANAENVDIAHAGECTEDKGMILTEDPSAFCKIYPTASGC